jgi:REP element-mobilizing transposase RayT
VPQSFVSLHCHLVFSTKNRHPWITADVQPRLFEYLGGIARGQGAALVAAGGMPDHVHLLVSLNKTVAVADLLRELKSESSRWLHEAMPSLSHFAWQTGYGAFAVSFSETDRVKAYLAAQPEHHRQRTFKEEFLALLARHQIEYDERYLWV